MSHFLSAYLVPEVFVLEQKKDNQSTTQTTNQSQLTHCAPALNSTSGILDEDEGKEVVKIFKGTMGKLEEFEHERIKLLGQDVQTTSLNKLKNHIIVSACMRV